MFSSIEKYNGPVKILLGLIAVTFIGFGANTIATGGSSYIAEVGDQKISQEQVNNALRHMQSSGDGQASQASVFQALLQRAYLVEGARMMGIGVSTEALKKQIVSAPVFQDNGQFSQTKFNDYLKQAGLTEDQLVADERQALALNNLNNLAAEGAIVSDVQAKQIINLLYSARIVRMAAINPEAFMNKVSVDDATLKKEYEADKKNYILPQAVKFQYLALTPQDIAAKQTASEAEIKAAYEKSTNEGKVRRSVQHILIPLGNTDEEKTANKQAADKIAAEAKANPDKFGELAKQYSVDEATSGKGGDLGFIQQGGGLAKPFEDKAFALAKGEVSDPVEVEYGYHIIKVKEIRDKPNFEQDKPLLEEEVKLEKARQAFAKAREELEAAAFDHPKDLAKVAEKVGVKLNTVDQWVSRPEAEREAQNLGAPEMVKALFSEESLKNKHNSELFTLSNGAVGIVRVTDVRPETTEPFESAKQKVQANYVSAQAHKMALDQAKQALADLKTGEKADITWSPVQKLSRADAGRALGPNEMNELLSAKPQKGKPSYMLAENLPQPVLIEIQGIETPENPEAQIPQAKAALVNGIGANTFEALMRYLQREIKQKQGTQKLGTEP